MNLHDQRNRIFNYLESIPIQCLGATIFFWNYHKLLVYLMEVRGINLGAVKSDRHVVPLYAEPQTNLGLWILPASIVLAGLLLIFRKILLQQATPPSRFFVISILSFLVIGISVAMIDGYQEVDGQHILGVPRTIHTDKLGILWRRTESRRGRFPIISARLRETGTVPNFIPTFPNSSTGRHSVSMDGQ